MLAFLILLGITWIVLKIVTKLVEIPFKLIKWVFSLAGSVLFWILLIVAIIIILI